MSFKGIGNGAIRYATYDFPLVFHCNHVAILHRFRCSFVLCGQGSSLLWTPALRPLYWFNEPAQGEEGNW